LSRLWSCGFELQSVTTGVEFDSTSGTAPTIDTGTFSSGLAAIKFNPSAATSYMQHQFATTSATNNVYVRFKVQFTTFPGANSITIAVIRSAAAGNNLTIRCNTAGTIFLNNEQTSAQVGSTSSAMSLNTWYRIEFSYVYATGAANAYLTLDTANTGAAFATGTASATIATDTFRLGFVDSATGTYFADDVAINNQTGTFENGLLGPGNIFHLQPAATGDINGFLVNVGGTAGAANNYTRVSEITPNDATTYNGSAVLSASDLFDCINVPNAMRANDSVSLVSVGVRMADLVGADATAAFVAQIEKITGGTKSQSSNLIPNNTSFLTNQAAVPKQYPLTTYLNPDNDDWTYDTLNTLQVGYALTATNVQTIAISTVWVLVEFVPEGLESINRFGNYGRYITVADGMSRSEVAN
jgi:hypothetical protein